MDLVNLMYKYINRFINSDELLEELKKLELNHYSKEEEQEIKQLILDVQNIKNTTPNEIDDIERKRLGNIEHFLGLIEQAENTDLNDDLKKLVQKKKAQFLKDQNKVYDGGVLFQSIFDLLTNHDLIGRYAKAMNDLELLEFITQYISVPMPPILTQDKFNDLVRIGIKRDMREDLWRLAFNYNHKEIDFTLIEDYFILKRDDYYLTELISAVEEDLNEDKLIDKIIDTLDKDFIDQVVQTGYQIGIFSDEEIKEIIRKCLEKKLLTYEEGEKLTSKLN